MAERQRIPHVCVFCGARPGVRPEHLEVAREFGTLLAGSGLGLVFGAGGVGMMGAVSAAAEAGGAPVVGIVPDHLFQRELGEITVANLRVVGSMHERKTLMYQLSDGFVALPGGLGTMEELFEIATWAQLDLHAKPTVVLNHAGYFDPLVEMLDRAVEEGFLYPAERSCLLVADSPQKALELMALVPATPYVPGRR
jgi:uncharacterized protein (TIGR00730 family)